MLSTKTKTPKETKPNPTHIKITKLLPLKKTNSTSNVPKSDLSVQGGYKVEIVAMPHANNMMQP
jgi:hypothetical protein